MGWRLLGDGERDDLLNALDAGTATLDELAERVEMNVFTLARRLQEWRHQNGYTGEGASRRPPPKRELEDLTPALDPGRTYKLANPTDTHGVYADPYAWELALELIHAWQPDDIIWGNDCMDLGVISTYSKVSRLPDVQDELDDEFRRRRELKSACPSATLWWLADNHVYERYRRYIWKNAPELADMPQFQLEHIVHFPAERIGEAFNAGDTLRVIHGTYVRKWPGQSVLAEIQDNPVHRRGRSVRSIMAGHVHRFGFVALPSGVEGLECGCLQDLRPQYLKEQRVASNWSHGLGFARYGQDWSKVVPDGKFYTRNGHLCARLEGTEYRVKLGKGYSGH